MKADDVKTIAIVGAGDMGHGIAQICATAGLKVNLYDIKQEFVDRGISKIKGSLEKQVAKEKMSADDMNKAMANVKGFTVLADAVKDIQFMIEAAPEILDLKQKIFKEIDENAPADAILASNTSNMSITDIASATNRPDKVCGVHFFNPVAMMLLVEVIRGQKTSDETMNVGNDLMMKLKNIRGTMVPVRVEKDTPGFIFNRINAPVGLYMSELLDQGVNPEAVDAKLRSAGAPMGSYELMDYTGLDVNFHGMEYFGKTLSPDFKPGKWLKGMMDAGTLGKKSGKGIFTWVDGQRPNIDMAKADPNFDPMDNTCLQVNEGTKLLEDKVARSAAEIDLAMMHGGGAKMGPFAMAKSMGWDKVAARCEEIAAKTGISWFKPTETLKKGNIQI